jgi:prepilin-type N-terminal cleavage/methylation domain-containing protein
MNQKPCPSSIKKRGMTLAEVVIAIAIMASTVPLIMAATSSAQRSRQSAETDTRSAWLVRVVQRRIQNEWAAAEHADLKNVFPFPTEDSPEVTVELAYAKDGTLITSTDTEQANYLVSVQAEPYELSTNQPTGQPLALISIKIRDASHKRMKLEYRYVSAREGNL